MCGIAVLFLVGPLPVRRMGNRWMDDEQKDGWGTDGRMANKRTDGEQTDVKQSRKANRWMEIGEQTDGWRAEGWLVTAWN